MFLYSILAYVCSLSSSPLTVISPELGSTINGTATADTIWYVGLNEVSTPSKSESVATTCSTLVVLAVFSVRLVAK